MKLLCESKRGTYNAEGEFNPEDYTILVKKGAKVNPKTATNIRNYEEIDKLKKKNLKDGYLQVDMKFSSLSSALNFISGYSSNGYRGWKDANGKSAAELGFKGKRYRNQ